jgi:hypothetical protein
MQPARSPAVSSDEKADRLKKLSSLHVSLTDLSDLFFLRPGDEISRSS